MRQLFLVHFNLSIITPPSIMAATSSNLLVLFKDLSGSFEKILQLLNLEDREIALLVLRGRFFQLNFATETKIEEAFKSMRGKRPLERQRTWISKQPINIQKIMRT